MRRAVKAFATTVGTILGSIAALGLLTLLEALFAYRKRPPDAELQVPVRSGLFGEDAGGTPLELAVLGDSLAVGFGADDPDCTVGVLLAEHLASGTGRPVRLRNAAVIGAESKDLAGQIARLTRENVRPDVVVIVIGGNEIMRLHRIGSGLQCLSAAVHELRRRGSQVVVATCPDMGTVTLFSQPLRYFAHWMSRLLATAQTIVVLRAGGRTVSLADTLGELFRSRPSEMFSPDHVHPSSQGYSRAAEVLLPSVRAAAGYPTGLALRLPHRIYRHDRHIHRLAWLAFRAARHAGVEVCSVSGHEASLVQIGRRTLKRPHEAVRALPKVSSQ